MLGSWLGKPKAVKGHWKVELEMSEASEATKPGDQFSWKGLGRC